jgi:hypothetical protein
MLVIIGGHRTGTGAENLRCADARIVETLRITPALGSAAVGHPRHIWDRGFEHNQRICLHIADHAAAILVACHRYDAPVGRHTAKVAHRPIGLKERRTKTDRTAQTIERIMLIIRTGCSKVGNFDPLPQAPRQRRIDDQDITLRITRQHRSVEQLKLLTRRAVAAPDHLIAHRHRMAGIDRSTARLDPERQQFRRYLVAIMSIFGRIRLRIGQAATQPVGCHPLNGVGRHWRQVQHNFAGHVEPARPIELHLTRRPARHSTLPHFPHQRRIGRIDACPARHITIDHQRQDVVAVVMAQRI